MTRAQIDDTVALMRAAGRTTIAISLTEWREWAMATKAIKATIKTDAKGRQRVVPRDTAPLAVKLARKGKADSRERRLRANREAKR